MKNISTDAGLSQLYTNHSIRATCITVLDSAGNEARHIMSVSGHRSEASIRSYSKTDMAMKRKMCNILSSTIASPPGNKYQKVVEDEADITDEEFSNIDFNIKQNQLKEISATRNFNFGVNLESSPVHRISEENKFEQNEKNQVVCDNMASIFGNMALNPQ